MSLCTENEYNAVSNWCLGLRSLLLHAQNIRYPDWKESCRRASRSSGLAIRASCFVRNNVPGVGRQLKLRWLYASRMHQSAARFNPANLIGKVLRFVGLVNQPYANISSEPVYHPKTHQKERFCLMIYSTAYLYHTRARNSMYS